MNTSNGNKLYKKLKSLYGNSFNDIISHHSDFVKLDNPEQELIIAQELESKISEVNVEDILCVNDELSLEKDSDWANTEDINDVYDESEKDLSINKANGLSVDVHKQIELLAKKVTKSIMDSKNIKD